MSSSTPQEPPLSTRFPVIRDFGLGRVLDHFEASLDALDPEGHFLQPSPRLRQLLGLERGAAVPPLPDLLTLAGHRELVATALRSGSDLQLQGAISGRGCGPNLSIRLFHAPSGTRRRWVILTPSGPDQPLAISGMESLGLLLMHEVNNVLTTLSGFAEFQLAQGAGGGEMEEPLRDAVRLARRSATIIEFLRQLAQRQGLDEQSRLEPPNRPLEEIIEVAGWLVENRHRLVVDLAADPRPLPLKPNLVRLALLNLLMNALKALGSLPGRIGISSREREDGVLLSLSDSGPGIAPEAREEIFRQGVTSGRGLGLGLALVKEVALRHGGNVEVDQKNEEGVQVSLFLPRPD